jgi:hypothetical protein
LRDLRYPVLVIERGEFDICHEPRSVRPGLIIDQQGLSYLVVEIDDPFFRDGKPLPREERRRLVQDGLESILYAHYKGPPLQLSVDDVRQKIVWLVSARGHVEIPQGLPDLSHVESVAELIDLFLTTGFR